MPNYPQAVLRAVRPLHGQSVTNQELVDQALAKRWKARLALAAGDAERAARIEAEAFALLDLLR